MRKIKAIHTTIVLLFMETFSNAKQKHKEDKMTFDNLPLNSLYRNLHLNINLI